MHEVIPLSIGPDGGGHIGADPHCVSVRPCTCTAHMSPEAAPSPRTFLRVSRTRADSGCPTATADLPLQLWTPVAPPRPGKDRVATVETHRLLPVDRQPLLQLIDKRWPEVNEATPGISSASRLGRGRVAVSAYQPRHGWAVAE